MVLLTVIFLVTFTAMELFSYLVHRFVYHRWAWFIHKSHHSPRKGIFEWNDIFPVTFSVITIALMVYAFSKGGNPRLVALSTGITAYGLSYFVVHDLYVHRRVKSLRLQIPLLRPLKQAHAVHHRSGGEPYGLFFFLHPKEVTLRNADEIEGA